MPQGRVWPKDQASVQTAVLEALAPAMARETAYAGALLLDAFPTYPVYLLPEWEATLGLPDPCAGTNPTLQQRQAQVRARFTATGGQSILYFTAYAATLGYTITVQEFAPFRAGKNRAGDPCQGAAWASTWRVTAPLNTITSFRAGASAAGEPLRSWGNAVLECELTAIAPAHTVLQFAYAS